ncbi:MAG: site-specific integrase [Filimonas sp.]|nr:site-specific integrase [Filimonas sp.]
MRSTQTFSVDFIVRALKFDKTMDAISAKITVDGEAKELSLSQTIPRGQWDWNSEQVKGRTQAVKDINTYIDDVRAKIISKYRELQRDEQIITAQSVKDSYLGIQKKLKKHSLTELLAYYKKIMEDKLAKGNMKNYNTTIDYVYKFLESVDPQTGQLRFSSKNVFLSEINKEFATNLEHYIRITPIKDYDPCKGNGLAKHMQRFKRILNWADDEIGWLSPNPIAKYICGIKKNKRAKLSLQDVCKLEMLENMPPELEYALDLFIFSCYTGLAFADVMKLSLADIEEAEDGVMWLKYYRQKTDGIAAVPILKQAGRIIKKYLHKGNALAGGPIFPQITNQYVNRQLKVIQLIAGISIKLTFHLARHTFATTIALKFDIPVEVVQIMLGHTKITTTMIYTEVDEEKVAESTRGWQQKLENRIAKFIEAQREQKLIPMAEKLTA